MMNTSSKISRCLVDLLEAHGVKHVVASPGSRNAPLLIALSASELDVKMVTDERTAAFVALGIASISMQAVAIVCTSGTALLNYAPAVAEAYYRRLPLIVVSADRPMEWIGQDDSQTIVQPGALTNYVKRSYDIPVGNAKDNLWFANRVINDALLEATNGRKGPVHINIQLGEPLGELTDDPSEPQRIVRLLEPAPSMPVAQVRELGRSIASPCRVMIVCGFLPPDKTLNRALNRLADLPNVIVLTETIANLHGNAFIGNIDATLAGIKLDALAEMRPDVVISTGGAIVSRHIKQFIRNTPVREHWHVGRIDDTVDCFRSLTLRVEMEPATFFAQLASAMQPHRQPSDYAHRWTIARDRAISLTQAYCAKSPWSDLRAFATLMPLIPRGWNLQLSNGTSIRYAQLFGNYTYHRCDCNRGVSGIDGCTSTAIGASLAYRNGVTLLITGDMSALYDIGALGIANIPARFKMIVLNNEGGGIFRFISSTKQLPMREEMFCVPQSPSWQSLAEGFGLKYFEADDEQQLRKTFKDFANEYSAPAILLIKTPGELSGDILTNFFDFCKSH